MVKAKSLLSIFTHSNSTRNVSISDVSKEVFRVLHWLAKYDEIFLKPVHFNGSRESPLDLNQNTTDDIGQLILNSEWNEITKHEGVGNPTLHYTRVNDGFSFNAKFYHGDQKAFYINIGLGYLVNGISISSFNENVEFEYSWYREVLYRIVEIMNPFYATVKLSNQPSNIFYKEMNIKYPIGWITYFSDNYEICIPNDLEEVRYEFVEGGKYLYTSDEDFMKDKEAYFGYREKLKRIITEIKDRVPEFSKESASK